MNPAGTNVQVRRPSAGWALAAVASLAVVVVALHGGSLRFGLFMDDYAHFRQLRECDWSLSGLTDACRLELVGGVIELWWLPDCTLRFFRPVALGLMKLTYTLTGWSPAAMHVASLVWHLSACTLLMILLRRMGGSARLAWAVAGLFAIHPGHVVTVQWIACQTELMVTTLLLGATFCFARFRGWPGFERGDGRQVAGPRHVWAVASTVLFALALGCRENAVMFPLVVAAVEPLVWRRRTRAALTLYAVLGLLLVAYLALRWSALGDAALPPRPYVITPSEPDFLRRVFDKGWYYLLGEFLLIPCVPIAGLPYFQARPVLFYGLAAGLGLLLLGVCLRFLRRPPGLIGPAWMLGFMVPALPVFASPHHLYLPAVGWAVTMMLLLRGLGSSGATWLRQAAMWSIIVVLGVVFSAGTLLFGVAFETGKRVEDCLVEEIAAAPSGLVDRDTIYIANLPLLGHYARLAVEQRTGLRGLRVIALTWSPRILGLATPAELRWVDARTVEVRIVGDAYFGGPLARLVEEATGQPVPAMVDRTPDLGVRVTVLERDAEGVHALRFEFQQPPAGAGLHLFWGSRSRWAYEVRPAGRPMGTPEGAHGR